MAGKFVMKEPIFRSIKICSVPQILYIIDYLVFRVNFYQVGLKLLYHSGFFDRGEGVFPKGKIMFLFELFKIKAFC